MKKKDAEKFRKLLLLERQQILQHLHRLEGDSESELDQTGGDSIDLASMEINQNTIHKMGSREKKLLSKIELALGKMDAGDFGSCEQCGEEIAVGRLEARPVTQFCIDCKTEQELNERRYGEADEDADEDEAWTNGSGGESFDESAS